MSFAFDIRDAAKGELEELIGFLRSERARTTIGEAAVTRVQGHLFDHNQSHPNRLGGERTNFYSRAAKSTTYVVVVDGVLLTIGPVGFRQRYEGGVIAMRGKMLTIPAVPEAHGRRARAFQNLEFGMGIDPRSGRPRPALVEARATALKEVGRGKKKRLQAAEERGGRVIFWLARRVNQEADKSILPTAQQIGEACVAAARSRIRRRPNS